ICVAQTHSAVHDSGEYTVDVGLGLTNYAKHLAGGGLVFKRFCKLLRTFRKLPRPRLLSLEQPRVLYGDDCLVSERLEQINLSVGEWTHLGASDTNHTDGPTRTDQRDGQHGPMATKMSRPVAAFWVLFSFGLQIRNVYGSALESSTSGQSPTT